MTEDDAGDGSEPPIEEFEQIVTVARFFSTAEAQAARLALEDAGIAASATDEVVGSMYGVAVGSRLQVRASDETAAREVLDAAPASGDDLPPEIAEPPCPACSSRNVLPEAWVVEPEEDNAQARSTRRRWYYVCSDCHEAWPA